MGGRSGCAGRPGGGRRPRRGAGPAGGHAGYMAAAAATGVPDQGPYARPAGRTGRGTGGGVGRALPFVSPARRAQARWPLLAPPRAARHPTSAGRSAPPRPDEATGAAAEGGEQVRRRARPLAPAPLGKSGPLGGPALASVITPVGSVARRAPAARRSVRASRLPRGPARGRPRRFISRARRGRPSLSSAVRRRRTLISARRVLGWRVSTAALAARPQGPGKGRSALRRRFRPRLRGAGPSAAPAGSAEGRGPRATCWLDP